MCARKRSARHTGNFLTTRSRRRRGSNDESLLLPYVSRRKHVRLLKPVRQKLPAALARTDLEMLALDYFRRLGHDNHHSLFQVYGWEEKKTKTSWTANTVDHEKLAEARIHAMTAADLNRFMVTCALVPDLYSPTFYLLPSFSSHYLEGALPRFRFFDSSAVTLAVIFDASTL